MTLTFNGFLAEVRRHFGKYPPQQKASIMFRFSIALSVFSLVLIGTGILVDQFHAEDARDIKLHNGLIYHSPGITIGHTRLKLVYPECETPESTARGNSRLFNVKGVSFRELATAKPGQDEVYDSFVRPPDESVSNQYFGDFVAFYYMGQAAKFCSWFAFAVQILSIVISVITQTPPSAFLTNRPTFNQTPKQFMWGSIHHALTLLVALLLVVDISIVSTYLDLTIGRVIELSFELCNFSPANNELDIMKLYGGFLQENADVNGFTGKLYKVAIGLTLFQMILVFFQGTDQVRSESSVIGYSLPASKLRQLPWYSSIWRFRFAALFLVFAYFVDIISSVYTREHGYSQNLYAWTTLASARTGTGSTRTGALSDFIMDKLAQFYISEALPTGAMWGSVPLVICLAIGSTDPLRFFSKIVQLTGLIVFLKAIFSMSTLVPIPSTVIAKPYCYDEPPQHAWSLSGLTASSISCNHLMFSVIAAMCTMSLMVVVMYVRFGPSVKRYLAYAVLFSTMTVLSLLPVAARLNYSADVFVGAVLVILIMMCQSAAFKLLFRFDFPNGSLSDRIGKLNVKPGEILNDKIVPTIAECIRRIEVYRVAARESPGLIIPSDEVDEIQLLYKSVGDAIKVAQAAKPIQPMSSEGLVRPPAALHHQQQPKTPPNQSVDDIISMLSHANEPPISVVPQKEVQPGVQAPPVPARTTLPKSEMVTPQSANRPEEPEDSESK